MGGTYTMVQHTCLNVLCLSLNSVPNVYHFIYVYCPYIMYLLWKLRFSSLRYRWPNLRFSSLRYRWPKLKFSSLRYRWPNLRFSSLRYRWHHPSFTILFRSFVLLTRKDFLNYLVFQSFNYKRSWWRLKRSWWRLKRSWWRLKRTWWRLKRSWWRLKRSWWRLLQKMSCTLNSIATFLL